MAFNAYFISYILSYIRNLPKYGQSLYNTGQWAIWWNIGVAVWLNRIFYSKSMFSWGKSYSSSDSKKKYEWSNFSKFNLDSVLICKSHCNFDYNSNDEPNTLENIIILILMPIQILVANQMHPK